MRALFPLVVCACASAQEPWRDGVFGEVHDRDGKVFAAATVTLVHIAHPALVDPKYLDRVTATTDERGRFRAQLLPGMRYFAWASTPVVDGTYRCTKMAEDVVAGVPVLLEEDELHWQRRGASPWTRAGHSRWRSAAGSTSAGSSCASRWSSPTASPCCRRDQARSSACRCSKGRARCFRPRCPPPSRACVRSANTSMRTTQRPTNSCAPS